MTQITALIAAAGSGQRLGLGPKAFVEVGGRTLLELAASTFLRYGAQLVVAVPEADAAKAERLLPRATIVIGGADRQATVRAMLTASHGEVVVVHDVARPFLTGAVLQRVLAAVAQTGAATASLAPADTVVSAADGRVHPRELLRLVQTPQGFDRSVLAEAHRLAAESGFSATDDAALVRRLGKPVELVQGSPLLAKLTVAADLPLFEALHAVWSRQEEATTHADR